MEITVEVLDALSEAIERDEAVLRRETKRYHMARHSAGLTLCAQLDRVLRARVRRHDQLCRLWLGLREQMSDSELDMVSRALLSEVEVMIRLRLGENDHPEVDDELPF